jgi:glycine betaine/proline transport system ATP-binding protein
MTTTTVEAPALELTDLEVAYTVRGIDRPVLRGVTLRVEQGATYGLVGESGCGKTTAAFAAMHHLPSNGKVVAGSIRVGGKDVSTLSDTEVRRLRSSTVSMVYQNPGSALNPSIRVGDQVAEAFELGGSSHAEALERSEQMLRKVQISDPVGVMRRFPHQLSGGMQQRVGLARALAGDPDVMLLDEPFSALDPMIRRDMQDEMVRLHREVGKTMVFVTHDLSEALKLGDRILLMRDGAAIQLATGPELVGAPVDAYVREFVRDIPKPDVLTLRWIMRPARPGDLLDGPELGPDVVVREATRVVLAADRPARITVGGSLLGMVGAEEILSVVADRETAA